MMMQSSLQCLLIALSELMLTDTVKLTTVLTSKPPECVSQYSAALWASSRLVVILVQQGSMQVTKETSELGYFSMCRGYETVGKQQ